MFQHLFIKAEGIEGLGYLCAHALDLLAFLIGAFGNFNSFGVGDDLVEPFCNAVLQILIGYADGGFAFGTTPPCGCFTAVVVASLHSAAAAWADDRNGQLEVGYCLLRVPFGFHGLHSRIRLLGEYGRISVFAGIALIVDHALYA